MDSACFCVRYTNCIPFLLCYADYGFFGEMQLIAQSFVFFFDILPLPDKIMLLITATRPGY